MKNIKLLNCEIIFGHYFCWILTPNIQTNFFTYTVFSISISRMTFSLINSCSEFIQFYDWKTNSRYVAIHPLTISTCTYCKKYILLWLFRFWKEGGGEFSQLENRKKIVIILTLQFLWGGGEQISTQNSFVSESSVPKQKIERKFALL